MNNGLLILLFVVAILLFFWGVYKAVKTQENKYMWALAPFMVLMLLLFLM